MEKNILVAIDVGTTKVCTLIAENENDMNMHILGVGVEPMSGMKKGQVIDIPSAQQAVDNSVHRAERSSGLEVDNAVVNLAGSHITSVNNRAAVGIVNGVIQPYDVQRVTEAVKAIPVENNRAILHTVERSFCVDGVDGVRSPLGLYASRLELEANVIMASKSAMENVRQVVLNSDIEVSRFVLNAMADAEVVLTDIEKQMGVVVCDIGGGTIDLSIYINGDVWHNAVIPVGGSHITGDISQRFHLPLDQAEEVKKVHGSCLPDYVDADDYFYCRTFSRSEAARFSRKDLAVTINMRMEEMFQLIIQEIKRSGYDNLLPAGLVLTGGTALMPGIDKLGSEVLGMPVRIGKPENLSGMIDQLDSPMYSTAVGLLYWPLMMKNVMEDSQGKKPKKNSFFSKVKEGAKLLLPW